MGSRLDPDNPAWPASTQTRSRNRRVTSRARERAAEIERDVDAFAFVGKPRPFRPRRRKRRRDQLVIRTAACPDCGETTSSVARYFCAGCHFAGWWGRWSEQVRADA